MEGGGVAAFFHVPAGRLRAEVDLCHDKHRRDGSATQHPAPGRGGAADDGNVLESDADKETEHDAECGPHLPHHCEGAADCFWVRIPDFELATAPLIFGEMLLTHSCIDRGGRTFGSDGKSQNEASNEEVPPSIGCSHPKRGYEGDGA